MTMDLQASVCHLIVSVLVAKKSIHKVYDGALILSFLCTPGAVGVTALLMKGFGGVDPL